MRLAAGTYHKHHATITIHSSRGMAPHRCHQLRQRPARCRREQQAVLPRPPPRHHLAPRGGATLHALREGAARDEAGVQGGQGGVGRPGTYWTTTGACARARGRVGWGACSVGCAWGCRFHGGRWRPCYDGKRDVHRGDVCGTAGQGREATGEARLRTLAVVEGPMHIGSFVADVTKAHQAGPR